MSLTFAIEVRQRERPCYEYRAERYRHWNKVYARLAIGLYRMDPGTAVDCRIGQGRRSEDVSEMEAMRFRVAARWIARAVAGLLAVGFFCAADPSRAEDAGMDEFVRQVDIMAQRLAPIPSWKGVGYSPDFIALTSNYRIHIDDCIAYLSQSGHSKVERDVALMLMARLSLEDQIVFTRKLLDLYDRGAISDGELAVTVTPYVNIAPSVLFDNYADPAVRSLYDDILKRPGIEERHRKFIEWSRNGGDVKFKIKKWVHALGLD